MSFEFYKIMHLFGLMCLFFGFGGLLVSTYAGVQLKGPARKMAFSLHGLGLLLLLVGGFGMAAKLGLMTHLPAWVHAKLAIWVLLGAGLALVKRKGSIGWPIAILLLGLGLTAAILGIAKPF